MILFRAVQDIKRHREILWQLTMKNIRVQYRCPWFGFLWAFATPLIMASVLTFVFSTVMRMDLPAYPFFMYLITALFPWKYFQDVLMSGTTSIVDQRTLTKEAAFPRILIPLSVVTTQALMLMPSMCVILLFLILFKVPVNGAIVLLPFVILLHTAFVTGCVLITAALHVKFRDIRYFVEIGIFILFYLSPVVYPIEWVHACVSPVWFIVYLLNPFVGMITWYRVCFFAGFSAALPVGIPLWLLLGLPVATAVALCMGGLRYFYQEEKYFNDYTGS